MLKTPPLQTATATIETLCSRLQSATLLEDRRGAIMGLRSFAKQYPASVASGSLRELINILRRDGLGESSGERRADGEPRRSNEGGDVDTVRLVLETLLMLFNPDSNSPEASDEIALFMADEFSMRQDNILLLLSLLDPTSPVADYYSRMYSVQLLSAVCSARPERLQECILGAPLGVSRVVGVLDDSRDAVRNAGLLLLVDLTSGATDDLKKIVAFEDVFGKVFTLIKTEGGLAEAGITAQDCLSLLANLIRNSASNQTMFRESGCVAELEQLLQQAFPGTQEEAPFIAQNREKASWGLLQLLNLFLVPGESSTPKNQAAFVRVGMSQVLIDLGFSDQIPLPIRTAALKCAALLISSNPPLQESFAASTVALPSKQETTTEHTPQTNGTRSTATSNKGSARPSVEKARTYIIEALLDLGLNQNQADLSLRSAATTLIQAYLTKHDRIKSHFLQRAIAGHAEQEEAPNVVITLLHPGTDLSAVTFSACIVSDLIVGLPEAKEALSAVKEGNEAEGEDVLTLTQAVGSHLQEALQQSRDERLVAAYAGLLAVLLWDFAKGVDHMLAEGSALVQALVSAANPESSSSLISGLSAVLLGTAYEFSTKDSPIPRRTLAPLLTQKLGRGNYLDALAELRRQPAVRDFDLEELDHEDALLSRSFIDLFQVEYARLRKAIDKDPGIEVLPSPAAEAGVDRDVLDELRKQLQELKDELSQAKQEAVTATQQHEQVRMTTTKEIQTATGEVERLRKINESLQKSHASDVEKLTKQFEDQKQQMGVSHGRELAAARQETQKLVQKSVHEKEDAFAKKSQEYERRIAEMGNAHRSEQSAHATSRQQLESITAKHKDVAAREQSASQQLAELTGRHNKLQQEHQSLQSQTASNAAELAQLKKDQEAREAVIEKLQTEIQELKDDVKGKDDELASERAGFAELEKELDAAKKDGEATKKDLAAAKKDLDKANKEKDIAKAALTASQSSAKKGGPSKADAEKLKTLTKELEEAKEAEKSAKEELESMLLVMGDIESKRDQYRAKVKELGGEVSADSDEEDDEEEEGDDDDDVD